MIEYAPLCDKQAKYLQRCFFCWLNILEGGKRASKNITNLIAWANVLETHPDKLHLAAGVSVAAAKLNIIDSNGFGLKFWFEGRCREGEYQKRDALYIVTLTGQEKIILISGGGKDGDEKLIKGNSYGSAYATEINEFAPAFVKEMFDRTISSSRRWIGADLNPKPLLHWFYKEVLDFHLANSRKYPNYGLNYEHFTLYDNFSLTDDQIREVIRTYDKTSIWYKRDILGQRAAAEGVVYSGFNPARHIIRDAATKRLILESAREWYISNDYGTGTVLVFGLFCVCHNAAGENVYYLVKSFYWDAQAQGRQKADGDYAADLVRFKNCSIRNVDSARRPGNDNLLTAAIEAGEEYKMAGRPSSEFLPTVRQAIDQFVQERADSLNDDEKITVTATVIPDDALSFIAEVRKHEDVGPIWMFNRAPGTVLDGIRTQANLLSKDRYFIFDNESNEDVISEYDNYVWDPKAQLIGEDKPLKQCDHGKDMERYFLYTMENNPEIIVIEPVTVSREDLVNMPSYYQQLMGGG